MKWIAASTIVVASLFVIASVNPALGEDKPAEAKPARVLLITGCDVKAHDWRATSPVLREQLEETGKFEVVVSEEPLVLESSALADYDIILINYFNWNRPGITPKAQKNIIDFVKSGKGFVSFHFSCRAFGDWPEWRNLIGRVWVDGSGHGPRGKFKVTVADKDHFITTGLTDFEADDELYAKLVGDTPIHVLVEAKSDWSGRTEPLAWTLDYGKGRVFNIVLGHDVKALRTPEFKSLFTRGTDWVLQPHDVAAGVSPAVAHPRSPTN
ncbi:MAG: ThuA domain-containing protein [Phycisphaerae bacterium]|nr:ThuA domain-containing protein [Phycisphaerae bacterium]